MKNRVSLILLTFLFVFLKIVVLKSLTNISFSICTFSLCEFGLKNLDVNLMSQTCFRFKKKKEMIYKNLEKS